jgi:hypothetical protein
MSTDLLAVLFFFGFILLIGVMLGTWGLCAWIAGQIEAKRDAPREMVEADTKRLKAAIELEEKTIKRLELEVGTPEEDDIDRALRTDGAP